MLLPVYIKCRNCRKLFTQTVYKKKKSIPICPHCKTVNYESTDSMRRKSGSMQGV